MTSELERIFKGDLGVLEDVKGNRSSWRAFVKDIFRVRKDFRVREDF